MLPPFLIPEQTLITKFIKIIEALHKVPNLSSKSDMLTALNEAKNSLTDIKEKYKAVYTPAQLDELDVLHASITKQSSELLTMQTALLGKFDFLSAGVTPGATRAETIENFLQHHCASTEESDQSASDSDSDSEDDTQQIAMVESLEDDDTVIQLKVEASKVPLLNNLAAFHRQTLQIEKRKAVFAADLEKFNRLLMAHDRRLQRKRAREIDDVVSNLVSAIHAIQEKRNVPKEDFGIEKLYEDIKTGPAAIRESVDNIIAQKEALEEKPRRFLAQSLAEEMEAVEDEESSEEEEEEEEEEETASEASSVSQRSPIGGPSRLFKTPRAENDSDVDNDIDEEQRVNKKRRM